MKRTAIGLLLLALVGMLAFRGLDLVLFAFSPLGTRTAEGTPKTMYVEVPKGAKVAKIAEQLEQGGLISSSVRFQRLGRYYLKFKNIKAGEYQLSSAHTPMQMYQAITSGISAARAITVKEGDNIYQIGMALEQARLGTAKEFVRLCKDKTVMTDLGLEAPLPVSLEGVLFPDTYFFNRTMSLKDMIRQMYKRHSSAWDASRLAALKTGRLSRYELITLASMIEKETGAPEERPLISSVFHNRMKKGMRFQSDPTTIYGIWERYKGNLHRSDLLQKTPFNTYAITGLPLGPISNPGREAIDAALHPATSDYLYFVSKNDGTHYFSKTFQEHNDAVRRFQLDPSAREGKSWRDLSKHPSSPNRE